MWLLVLLLFLVHSAIVWKAHAVPLDSLHSLVTIHDSHNATLSRCVAVRLEGGRLLMPSSCPTTAQATLEFVQSIAVVDVSSTADVSVALSMVPMDEKPSFLWTDDTIQALSDPAASSQDLLALSVPRDVSFPPVLTEDATASIIEIDPVAMRTAVIDEVVYVDASLCLNGTGTPSTDQSKDSVVCVLPRNLDHRGSSSVSSSASSVSRFLVQHDATTGRHALLGVGLPLLVDTQEANGFRLFAWLPSRLTHDAEFAQLWGLVASEADRVLGPPVAAITPVNEFIVGVRDTQTSASFCTGSLILSRYVVTAAHCAYLGHKLAWVAVGALEKEGATGERIPIQRTYIHPKYNAKAPGSAPSTYDVMVLELARASSRTPIALNRYSSGDLVGQRATVMGYGASAFQNDETTTPSTTLRAVELPIGPALDACAAKLGISLDESVLCAGGETGKDACVGDSGGPLVLEPHTANQRLLALVSFGRGCGVAGYAGVYTRIDKTLPFIKDISKIGYTGTGFVWNVMGK